jgi:hypothetical protein
MRLKEYVKLTFANQSLDVYVHGRHELHQPFNSETGNKFANQDEASAWLLRYYPDYFTP